MSLLEPSRLIEMFGSIKPQERNCCCCAKKYHTCHTAEVTLDVLRHVFEERIISRRAEVVWPPRSCDLTPLDYYLWGAKCYADKPETIDALKDNIREAIGEIQLHKIDNVLKNWARLAMQQPFE